MRINKKIAGYIALAVAAILALVFMALPPLIKYIAVKKIDEATGRKSEIAKISLNPFTLSAGISGVRLSEKGSSAPFLTLSSARLSLSPLSLPKRSFIITEIHLASPYLHIVRNAPNSFNFSDLVADKKEEKKEAKGGTPLFSINNITVKNGSVDFQDRALSSEKQHSVRKVDISVPFYTNMPYLADRYVSPHFSAVINGSPFSFDGRLKPLTKSVEATIAINVKHFDLPYYLGYLPVPPPVKVNSGTLETALELGYRVHQKSGPDFRASGSMALERVALSQPNGAPLAALDRGVLRIRNVSVFSRQGDLTSLELDGMELFAARDRSGIWNFKRIGSGSKSASAKPSQEEAEKKPFDLKLAKLSFKGGKIHFSDAVPQGGFKTDLREIDLSVDNFSTSKGQRAPFALSFASARGETASLKGEFAVAPVEMKGTLTLNGIPLKDYYPYLYDTLTAPISGSLGISSDLAYNEAQGLVLERTALKGEDLAAPFGPKEGFRLQEALISGIAVNLKLRKAVVERVDLKGGNFTLSSEKGGAVSAQRLLRPKKEAAAAKLEQSVSKRKVAKGKQAAAPPFSYRIEKISGSDIAINFTDRMKEEAPVFNLSRMSFSLGDITGPKQGAIPFTLASGYAKGGRIAASGSLTPAPLKLKGKIELHRIPLRDFDAYINQGTTIFIADGALDTKMSLNLEKAGDGIKGNFSGALGVRSFYCQDTVREEDLLKWERLQLDRFSGTVGPFTLAVGEVSLTNFYSRIIVEKDGTLNLQHLREEKPQGAQVQTTTTTATVAPAGQGSATKKGIEATQVTQTTTRPAAGKESAPTAGTAAPAKPGSAAPAAQEATAKPHPIKIDAITMQGGTLAFSDQHLTTPFDTTFFNLGGRISGLTSQSNRFAEVDLRGNLDNHSPLAITGTINPLRGDLYLDLKIAFSDIELSPFTPYSDTYLGYNVAKGKLFLDLSYRIDKKTLSSQNKVFIDQFSFGKEVESDKATKLPVRLAVALLKDRKGEIHLDLPVAGQTDDPKFSVWKIVLQMLQNLLAKAATSPLALLGSMFGGTEDFSAVFFTPGSHQLSQAEKDKLIKLSQALAERPDLNLEISGFVDRELDAEGYRNEVLVKKMKGEKFRTLVKQGKSREGQTQEETEISPEEYHLYLKAVYSKEKFPKPRNAFGFAKELPDAEMKKLLIANTVVGNNELQALARERGDAVKGFLLKEGKVSAQRLFEKSADIYQRSSREGSSGSRVEFGANIK